MRKVNYEYQYRERSLEFKARLVLEYCAGAEVCEKRKKATSTEKDRAICNSCNIGSTQLYKVEVIDILADQKTGYEKALAEEKTRREQAEGEVQKLLDLLKDKKATSTKETKPPQNRLGSRVSLSKAQVVDIWDLHYNEGWSVNKIHQERHIAARTVKRVIQLEGSLYTIAWVLEALQKAKKGEEVKQQLGVTLDTRLMEVRSEIAGKNRRNNKEIIKE